MNVDPDQEQEQQTQAPDPGRPPEHQLPAGFLLVLVASLAGGLPAGIFTTLASEPGKAGSPVYGLLLPWGVLPFFIAIVAGWRGRTSDKARILGWATAVAAALGLVAYGYAFLFHPRPADARKWFLFVPLWQWLLLARPALRCARIR